MGFRKSISKREIYSNATHQEIRKATNKQSNATSKAAGKRRTETTQHQQKEDHKNQSRNK